MTSLLSSSCMALVPCRNTSSSVSLQLWPWNMNVTMAWLSVKRCSTCVKFVVSCWIISMVNLQIKLACRSSTIPTCSSSSSKKKKVMWSSYTLAPMTSKSLKKGFLWGQWPWRVSKVISLQVTTPSLRRREFFLRGSFPWPTCFHRKLRHSKSTSTEDPSQTSLNSTSSWVALSGRRPRRCRLPFSAIMRNHLRVVPTELLWWTRSLPLPWPNTRRTNS